MTITLPKGNFLSSERVLIKDKEIAKIQRAASHAAGPDQIISLWEKIKDWFCKTTRVEAKHDIFAMLSPDTPLAEKIEHFKNCQRLLGDHANAYLYTETCAGGTSYMLDVGGDVGKLILFDCDTYDLVRTAFDHGGLKEVFKETDREQAWELLLDICSESIPSLDKITKFDTVKALVKPDVKNNPFKVSKDSASERYQCNLAGGLTLFQHKTLAANLERALNENMFKGWFDKDDQAEMSEYLTILCSDDSTDLEKIDAFNTLFQRVNPAYKKRFTAIRDNVGESYIVNLKAETGDVFSLHRESLPLDYDAVASILNEEYGDADTAEQKLVKDLNRADHHIGKITLPSYSPEKRILFDQTLSDELGITPDKTPHLYKIIVALFHQETHHCIATVISPRSLAVPSSKASLSYYAYWQDKQLMIRVTWSNDVNRKTHGQIETPTQYATRIEAKEMTNTEPIFNRSVDYSLTLAVTNSMESAERAIVKVVDWKCLVHSKQPLDHGHIIIRP